MTFQALDFAPYGILMIPFLAAFIFSIGFFMASLAQPEDFKIKTRIFIIIAFVVSIFAFAVWGFAYVNSIDENQKKATANLTQKYDVKNVDWESKDATVGPLGNRKDGKIILTANNGERYIFQYSVNKDTYEPTLTDMPIIGGNNAGKEKSAESLLKK